MIILTILGEEYKLWSFWLCSFLQQKGWNYKCKNIETRGTIFICFFFSSTTM
jgi:hypothetical protein